MDFKLPDIGEGVHEGELVKWLVQEGTTVKQDQPLVEIMTDKATVEIPSPFEGKIDKLLGKEGDTFKVGQTIIQYTSGGNAGASKASAAPAPTATPAKPAATASAPTRPATAPAQPQAMQQHLLKDKSCFLQFCVEYPTINQYQPLSLFQLQFSLKFYTSNQYLLYKENIVHNFHGYKNELMSWYDEQYIGLHLKL